jgi:lipoprotein
MKKLAILFSLFVVGCATKQPVPTEESKPETIAHVQITEDAGYLCKDNHTASCNLLRNYCMKNNNTDEDYNTDEDVIGFNKAVESNNE